VSLNVTGTAGSANVTPPEQDVPVGGRALFNVTLLFDDSGAHEVVVQARSGEGAQAVRRLAVEVSQAPPPTPSPRPSLEEDLERAEAHLAGVEASLGRAMRSGTAPAASLRELESKVASARTSLELARGRAGEGKAAEAASLVAEAQGTLAACEGAAEELEEEAAEAPPQGSRFSTLVKLAMLAIIAVLVAFIASARRGPPPGPGTGQPWRSGAQPQQRYYPGPYARM
jgi:hypothetical protein